MSKCSACQNDFSPSLKSTGLPYKTCDRCRNHDKKWRDTHKEHIKDYNEHYILDNKEKVKESKKNIKKKQCNLKQPMIIRLT